MTKNIITNEKTNITYTKEDFIKSVAKTCGKDMGTVRAIYNAIENTVADVLSRADASTDVSVRLFKGVSIDSTFVPEETKINNLTGETITTKSKIRLKANVTRHYRDNITNHNK